MSLLDNLLGSQNEMDRRRNILRENQSRGKAAEEQVGMELRMEGYEVEPTHEGADYNVRKRNPWTGVVIEEKKVEAKSGNASLTQRQKEEKRKSENYEVRRRNPLIY